MKKIIAALCLLPLSHFAQRDSVKIGKFVDDASADNKTFYFPTRELLLISDKKDKGVQITAFVKMVNDTLKIQDLKVKATGLGECTEKDEMIIKFADSTTLVLKSYQELNCKAIAWFSVTPTDINKLKKLKLGTIKFTNGKTGMSFAKVCPADNNDYFIQVFYALDKKKIKIIKPKAQ